MRATTILALLALTACGSEPEITPAHTRLESALTNGTAADGILGQLSERARTATRTDAGGFGSASSVAIGLSSSNDQLYVADSANERVLGYANAATLADGDPATLVLNQLDFTTTDFRNVPLTQQITPVGVAVDHGERVYVFDFANVLVYEDPFADDKVADYELEGEPTTLRAVRALSNNKLAVVGASSIEFYEQGSPAPYAQAGFAAPCANLLYDIAQDGDVYFVVCSSGILCTDGVNTCSGVYAYKINSVTGFVERDAAGNPSDVVVAYNDLIGARSLDIQSSRLLVADSDGHRILRFDNPAGHAGALFNTPGPPETPTDALTVYGQPDALTVPVPNYHSSGTPQVSDQGLSSPSVIAVGPTDRRMWVADVDNSRVTAYTDIASSNPGRTAQIVLGQPDDTHARANRLEPNSFGQIAGVAIGPGPGGLPRAAIADTASNRVLLFDDISSYTLGTNPDYVIGQSSPIDDDREGPPSAPTANRLAEPSHVAIGANGWVWVTDASNARVLSYEGAATNASADRVFGAINSTTGGVYAGFGAIAVSDTHLFVAATNRVFMYPVTSPGRKPARVFGQEQPPPGDPLFDDIGNLANRGRISAAPDSLSDVTGLAVDSSGRLWVADTGNHRVIWFDDPTSTTADLTDTVTADGVVGQPDLFSNTMRMGLGVTRFAFGGVSDIAVTDDGTLWVSDFTDSRVLGFFTPTEVDPTLGVARADLVLGQERFDASGANNATNGINASTLSGPFSVAADGTGRVLLVSDRGNNRALRFIDNRPPVVTGDGAYDVERGESLVVTVTVTDPENDPIDISPVDPYVGAVSGSSPLSVPITFQAPADAPVGSDVVVNVVATDRGPRAQRTTFSVVFHIVDRLSELTPGSPPATRPPLDPESGCVCSTGAAAMPWLIALLLVRRRRRG